MHWLIKIWGLDYYKTSKNRRVGVLSLPSLTHPPLLPLSIYLSDLDVRCFCVNGSIQAFDSLH